MQFTAWDEHGETCDITETHPDGTTLQFSLDSGTKQFDGTTAWSWKPVAPDFEFKGVFPSLGTLGSQTYRVTNSTQMLRTSLVEVTDFSSGQIQVAGFYNGTVSEQSYLHGVLNTTTRELTWNGAWIDVWAHQGSDDRLPSRPPQPLTVFDAVSDPNHSILKLEAAKADDSSA